MVWQIIIYIIRRKITNEIRISIKNICILKWKQHFSQLLGKISITTNQDIFKMVDNEIQIEQCHFIN